MSRSAAPLRPSRARAGTRRRDLGGNAMKFMLMMHAPKGAGDWQVSSWAPEDLRAHMEFMHRLNQEIAATGELVDGQGLAGPGEAKVVRATAGGVPAVTDGPFP